MTQLTKNGIDIKEKIFVKGALVSTKYGNFWEMFVCSLKASVH